VTEPELRTHLTALRMAPIPLVDRWNGLVEESRRELVEGRLDEVTQLERGLLPATGLIT